MFLLPGAAVLKPDLRDPLTKACDLRDALQVLAIGVWVQLKVRLEHLKLFLCERRPNPLGFAFVVALWITAIYIELKSKRILNELS